MHNKSQQRVIDLLRFLKIHKVVKQRQVYSWLEKLYTKYDWEKQNYCGTITASLVTKEVMPKDIWGKGTLMPFHDVNVLVPEKFDAYLKRLYGENYMNEEPKAKDRKSHLGRDQV